MPRPDQKDPSAAAPADPHGLTLAQQNAVDLLAGGKNVAVR